jgi:hypothetical protein
VIGVSLASVTEPAVTKLAPDFAFDELPARPGRDPTGDVTRGAGEFTGRAGHTGASLVAKRES